MVGILEILQGGSIDDLAWKRQKLVSRTDQKKAATLRRKKQNRIEPKFIGRLRRRQVSGLQIKEMSCVFFGPADSLSPL